MPSSIEVKNLKKTFKPSVEAVKSISFNVEEGDIFGFLGPNGAGKTTTISLLCTMLSPTSGTAKICGYDIINNSDEVRKKIGIVFQEPSLDEELTAHENLIFHANFYGIKGTKAEQILSSI